MAKLEKGNRWWIVYRHNKYDIIQAAERPKSAVKGTQGTLSKVQQQQWINGQKHSGIVIEPYIPPRKKRSGLQKTMDDLGIKPKKRGPGRPPKNK